LIAAGRKAAQPRDRPHPAPPISIATLKSLSVPAVSIGSVDFAIVRERRLDDARIAQVIEHDVARIKFTRGQAQNHDRGDLKLLRGSAIALTRRSVRWLRMAKG
jgi:hypothetical protein